MTDWEIDCLKYYGRILKGADCHWCYDFDDLPIDATCWEYSVCTCKKTKWGKIVNWFIFLFKGGI